MRYEYQFVLRAAAVVLAALAFAHAEPDAQTQSGSGLSATEWTAPGGDLGTTRYSTLTQITPANVKRLGAAWVAPLPEGEATKASPVIKGGLVFVTTTRGTILALDAARGTTAWTYKPDVPFNGNRGMGMGENLLFAGLSDSTVIALDQKTGKLVWQNERDPGIPAQAMSSAPAYANGIVVAVVTGGDNFARGRLMGLEASTGRQLWTFEVVPEPGDPGHETWPQDSDIWKYGGGAVWMSPSIDSELGLVYVGTGNAVPQFGGELRPGSNLYTDSVIALDLKTGKLRWHYQLVHHDIWEHDLGAPLVLYDTTVDGRPRKGLAAARTDGFLFMLDRESGEPLLPIEERPVPQDAIQKTWPTQPFPAGGDRVGPPCAPRELVPEGFEAGCYFDPIRADKPNVFMPHMNTRFAPLSYSPDTGYFYQTACVHPKWVRRAENPWVFIFPSRVAGVKQYGITAAIDSRTNRIVWERQTTYAICAGSGTTVTAGGLLLHTSPDGNVQAYDARRGDLLWQFQTGEVGAPSGNGPGGGPIAVYEVNGEQHIVAGNNSHVWAFKLDGPVGPRPAPTPPPTVTGWEGPIREATTITLGAENVFNVRNASRQERWTDPFAVAPSRARVAAGASVTFSNTSTVVHTIAARDGSWTTGPIQPGASASITLEKPGTFEYRCTDHPFSIGQLIVE
jgi:alcohol dehydrogenase (cytochrome c)